MLDTIGIQFPNTSIPRDAYSTWDDMKHHRNKNYNIRQYSFTTRLPNQAAMYYAYLPGNQAGLLKIEFSLPNHIYGNNVQMIANIKEAIDAANSMMPNIHGIPQLDLWSGILYRLDVCYNFQVGNLVPWYIKALLMLEYKYRRTRPYTSQGVQYQNERVIFRVYDKSRERKDTGDSAGALAAKGILRMEIELKREYIKKLSQSKKPTLRLITESWVYDVLENELSQLNLLGNSIGTVDSTLKILKEKYGTWEACALLGILFAKATYPSTELLAQDAGLHKNSIGRHIQKKFSENGLPPTLTNHRKPLPPLVVERKDSYLPQARKKIGVGNLPTVSATENRVSTRAAKTIQTSSLLRLLQEAEEGTYAK